MIDDDLSWLPIVFRVNPVYIIFCLDVLALQRYKDKVARPRKLSFLRETTAVLKVSRSKGVAD